MSARPRSQRSLAAALTALAVLAVGCSGEDADDSASDTGGSAEGTPEEGSTDGSTEEPGGGGAAPAQGTVEVAGTVAEDLPSPWGLVELPDGDLLVGSRDEATVLRVDPSSGETSEVGTIDGVAPGGEGGLLGLALDDGGRLYAYLTAASDNRVVRMDYADGALGAPEVVLDGIPKDTRIHHGGGLAFGPDGMLYAATGDAAEPDLAQDPDSPAGKILRMTPEGGIPEDNPDPDSLVYSLGHRNVQGLAWDDRDRLWASEFGARDLDELNLIEPGGNYGWPEFEGSGGEDAGFVDPVAEWPTDQASPSGLAYTDGALWMATLRGERLWRVPLDESGDAGEPEAFLEGEYGRLRAVLAVGPGELLLATNETDTRGTPEEGDDRLLRLTVS
ncbi:PQQ-dependent sugar dehydrogenase [Streptomyces spiramenti]|uniref:PQQ-dependent sugar dehydrogenase n=1 Tax=Streptomyces spiramenti TaxID=2720606 RepID=A0ABX1ALY5_9ACTN|nr:PQQ-dependent sugar dehydrogenase [Streptomyces spiramenti]NJP68122.1 PQQ-dependent sugar dehydrogenase [Streptomyces spiramenti]